MQPAPLKARFFETKDLISRSWQRWFNLVSQVGYVDRGDPSAYDFTEATLTTDATWNDLDLSSIVPKGAVEVRLYFRIKAATVGRHLLFRENGNANAINRGGAITQVANEWAYGETNVTLDKNCVIEYYGSNITFTEIDIVVRGWSN
jgi:hypothetical protein